MSSMHETLSDILKKIDEELTGFKNSGKPETDHQFQRSMINAALFFAAISSVNEKRNRTRPDGYEQRIGYEKYKATVSGPCHRMFLIMLFSGLETPNIVEGKVTSKDFLELAISVRAEYLDGKLAKGSLDDYKDYNGTPDYSEVYRDIQKLKTCRRLIYRFSYQLIKDCCADLEIRTDKNRQTERNAAKIKYMKRDVLNDSYYTNVSLSIAISTCTETINELNAAYANEKDSNLKQKLEKIFIPVYSNSPYFFLCISHRKNLPKEIQGRCDKYFVYVLTAAEYKINESGEYSLTHNVISQDFAKKVSALSANDYYEFKNINMNHRFYSYDDELNCCAMSYDEMRIKYERCCRDFKGYFPREDAEKQWLPIALPEGLYDKLSSLYKDDEKYKLNQLLKKEYETMEPTIETSYYTYTRDEVDENLIVTQYHEGNVIFFEDLIDFIWSGSDYDKEDVISFVVSEYNYLLQIMRVSRIKYYVRYYTDNLIERLAPGYRYNKVFGTGFDDDEYFQNIIDYVHGKTGLDEKLIKEFLDIESDFHLSMAELDYYD